MRWMETDEPKASLHATDWNGMQMINASVFYINNAKSIYHGIYQ